MSITGFNRRRRLDEEAAEAEKAEAVKRIKRGRRKKTPFRDDAIDIVNDAAEDIQAAEVFTEE